MGSLKIKIKNNKKKSVWRSQKENSAAVVGIKRNRKIKFNFKILDKKRQKMLIIELTNSSLKKKQKVS